MKNDIKGFLCEHTNQAVQQSFWRHRKREITPPTGNGVIFLGTGGNPEATFTQQPQTAGFIIAAGGVRIYVDPGPGAVVRAQQMNLDLGMLDAVYISHGHLDHYGGAEGVVEAMCWAMYARRGHLLAPHNVLDGEGIISYYHQGFAAYAGYRGGPQVIRLQAQQPITLKDVRLTPIKVYHSDENFGFILDTGQLTIGYTSDTNYVRKYSTPEGLVEVGKGPHKGPVMDLLDIVEYRCDIKEAFSAVDVLIANVTTHNAWLHRHITTLGLAHLLQGSHVKLCFITHFNHVCVEPVDLRGLMAQYIEETTGVKTLAAYDGAVHDLDRLLECMGCPK
ncbi:MBL fold metallo-hydrolase [Peptococcaceae bacterium 1198_IL3148]